METKDKVTFGLSFVALILSIYATIVTQVASSDDRKRTVRSQLTETLSKLTSLQMDGLKLQRDAQGDPQYLQMVNSVLGQQNGFLVDEAAYLADQIPNLTTTYELNTIGAANANAGNLLVAEKYYKRAVDVAPTDLYRAMALRSYAAFCYPQGRLQDGRKLFQQATEVLQGQDNYVRFTNGTTRQMWAIQELLFAHSPEKAQEQFNAAQKDFEAVDIEAMKAGLLAGLESSRKLGVMPPVPGTGVAPLARQSQSH